MDDQLTQDVEEALSPAWLTSVLGTVAPGATVGSVRVVEILRTVATKVRFEVDYSSGNDGGLPRAFCLKGYLGTPDPRFSATASTESRFYREIGPGIDVRIPPCRYTGPDVRTGLDVVLMDDLVAAGSRFHSALVPFTPETVASTLDQLARLNAGHWGDQQLAACPWVESRLRSLAASIMTTEQLDTQLHDSRCDGLAPVTRDAGRLQQGMAALDALNATKPACLVHGDAHAGNTYSTADGEIGLIDWQLLQRGCWALDVAYHIGAVLDPGDRERSERDLLEHYLSRLSFYGGVPPSWDEAWRDYRSYLVYGFYLWAITRLVDRPIIDTFMHRLGSAVAFHDSFGLLGV